MREGNDACGECGVNSIRLQEGVSWVCGLEHCIQCGWPHLFVIKCIYGDSDHGWEGTQIGRFPHECYGGPCHWVCALLEAKGRVELGDAV